MGILTTVKPAESRTAGAWSATRATRRAFLKATATAGGGLLLQALLPPLACIAMADALTSTVGEASSLGAFIRIAPDGIVTIMSKIRRLAKASRRCCRW